MSGYYTITKDPFNLFQSKIDISRKKNGQSEFSISHDNCNITVRNNKTGKVARFVDHTLCALLNKKVHMDTYLNECISMVA